MILLDANVLLRLIEVGHPHQRAASEAVLLLRMHHRERLVTCPQTLYEMYAVCTRPLDAPSPGLALAPADAMARVERAGRQFPLVLEPPGVLSRWKELVVRYGVIGKSAHDARLAAFMIERGIAKLLSFNDAHFGRYREIEAINPFDVLGIPHA